ncbi:MAG: HD domain-containing protein [candidate division KSB1 bacterium]|nr:HD domain-containing protein [candidate division KSB1 bacterium]MDZ7319109.1 HD domain-containing protein [candidate division KSB1 bacterium]
MTQKLIASLAPGDNVLSFFMVRKKEIKQQKISKEVYLSLELGDCSGRIHGSLWNDASAISKTIQVGDVVKVKGKVITFMEKNHIAIDKIRKAHPNDNIEMESFLPQFPGSIDTLRNNLQQRLEHVNEPDLKKLVQTFLQDQRFMAQFCKAPGGKLWHHAYLGGLLEHSFSVMEICRYLCAHYGRSVNADVVTTAAFLHDIGKIQEFSLNGFIDYSTSGRLLGHVVLGANLVQAKIAELGDFSESLKEQLIHCLLSHHGQKERGSPVVPMTLEALILSYADDLDSSVAAFQRIMSREKEPGKIWSNYVNLIDRFIYLGEEEKLDQN